MAALLPPGNGTAFTSEAPVKTFVAQPLDARLSSNGAAGDIVHQTIQYVHPDGEILSASVGATDSARSTPMSKIPSKAGVGGMNVRPVDLTMSPEGPIVTQVQVSPSHIAAADHIKVLPVAAPAPGPAPAPAPGSSAAQAGSPAPALPATQDGRADGSKGAGAPEPAGAAAPSGPATPTAASVPPLTEVLKLSLKELGQGGKDTLSQVRGLMADFKSKKPINITLDQVVTALFYLFLGFQLLLLKLLRPSPWWLLYYMVLGTGVGLGMSFLFYHNKKKKAEACEVLGTNLGMKGLGHLLGTLPSWLSYTEREKVDWLNAVLLEVWPYYDAAVCKMIKRMTEDIFDNVLGSMKVAGVKVGVIKSIRFKHLTFGDVPFRVESIHVSEHHKDAMILEADVRWSGEANITLAVEMFVGEFAKMCPKITDISFAGSLRIMLKPLVDEIPGFGAAVVTFRKPPRVKYHLDFGRALGGKHAANLVKPIINYVIDNQIIASFVWPQRLVVPILTSEAMQVEVAKLAYRNQGLIKVTVIQAKELRKTDLIGSSDPFTELSTDGKYTVSTKVVKNSLTPRWQQSFWLLVQEPTSQEMFVSVYDKDLFSAKELLTLNLHETFGAKELLGRCAVKLAPITAQEGEPVTKWFHLGLGDWSTAEGCGKGAGRIQLTCLYRSLESFTASEVTTANIGVVSVQIIKARNMPRARKDANMTIYARVKVGDQVETTHPSTSKTTEHSFTGTRNTLEFHETNYTSNIKIRVYEKSLLGDDELVELELALPDVAAACDLNPLSGKREQGLMLRQFKLSGETRQDPGAEETDDTKPMLYASVRFAPYF